MHHRKQVAITSDLAVPEYTLQHESTFKHSQRLTISDGHQRIVAHATKPDGGRGHPGRPAGGQRRHRSGPGDLDPRRSSRFRRRELVEGAPSHQRRRPRRSRTSPGGDAGVRRRTRRAGRSDLPGRHRPHRRCAGCVTVRSASISATSPICSHLRTAACSRCRCTRSGWPGWACPSSTAPTSIRWPPPVRSMVGTRSPSPWD